MKHFVTKLTLAAAIGVGTIAALAPSASAEATCDPTVSCCPDDGGTKPIASNKTKAGKAQNRRVEVKLSK